MGFSNGSDGWQGLRVKLSWVKSSFAFDMSIFGGLARKIRGPRCHLTADEKAWVERRMKQFGSSPIRRAPLDPTSEVLPKQYFGAGNSHSQLGIRIQPAAGHKQTRMECQSHGSLVRGIIWIFIGLRFRPFHFFFGSHNSIRLPSGSLIHANRP